ncbi:MAG: hypothetical protein ABUT39_00620, partial [Acidobacteriota bacterium]
GLPLAMSRFTCVHERAHGAISMHAERNALDFHDRNCFDCTRRVPVGFPNLSHLLGERERAQAHQREEAREREHALAAALESRAGKRDLALENAAHARRSLLALLDRLDREPSDAPAQELVETVRAVADTIGGDLQELIVEVVEAGGEHRVRAGLQALELTGYPSQGLGRLALQAVARHEAMEESVEIAGRQLDESHTAEIQAAFPGLLVLAEEPSGSVFDRFRASHPDPLLAAHRAAPEVVEAGLKNALSQEDKNPRRAAASAIVTFLNGGASLDARGLGACLIGSFRLPDDSYDAGPTSAAASWALAALLLHFPRDIEDLLDRHLEDGDENVRSGVLRTLMDFFQIRDASGRHSSKERERSSNSSPVQANAFQMILRVLAALPEDSRLQRLNEFLRDQDLYLIPWDLAAESVETLLGVAAVACQQADAAAQGSSILSDPRPKGLQELFHGARQMALLGLANALMEFVVWIARHHPDSDVRNKVLTLIFETLHPLPPLADRFRAMLVEVLGEIRASHVQQSRVLPEVYSAMTHASILVRSAACVAYKDLCDHLGAENLPSLLHESFLILLGDPYMGVHQRALYSLQNATLPEHYRTLALQRVSALVRVYADQGLDGNFLARALSKLLALASEDQQLFGRAQRYSLAIGRRLEEEHAYGFVREAGHFLRSCPGYGDLLLSLPITGQPFDHRSEFVVEQLKRLPGEEVSRVAERIVTVGQEVAHGRPMAVIPLLSLLNEHGEWDAAARLANAAVLACGNERSRLPQRLRLAVYAKALELELALEQRRPHDASALIQEIRALEAEIARDEEINRERRDVFPRVPAPASGD